MWGWGGGYLDLEAYILWGGGILREEILSGRLEGSMLQLQEGEERGEGINLEKELGEDTLISRGCGVQE